MTLAQLQALSGILTLTVNGTVKTSSTISLSAATSFSSAATIIQAGFTSPPFSVSYDSIANAFVFTTTLTGATATITEATGTLSASLYLTTATGAVLSQGAAIATPTTYMNSIINTTTNLATFMTVFDPDAGSGNTQKQAFQAWNVLQNNRYAYIAWDTDVTPLSSNAATTSLGYILQASASSGCVPIYGATYEKAAFLAGAIASIDFTQHNGRSTLAFKGQAGLIIDVQNQTQLSNLMANGYNGYGSYATANQNFNFYYPGSVTGQYKWLDSFINQIWMNSSFQLNLMLLLTSVKSVPYNIQGYTLIEAACMDTINAALNFGAIGAGVPLSSLQSAQVNNAAGLAIDGILATRGWYLQILPASAQSRANRTTPPMTFWYMDAGSVQQINLGSVEVQ
jgi:hypothetical protein